MAGKNLIADIRALIDRDAADPTQPEKSRVQLEKWRLIHKHVHDHPFPTNPRLSRAEQWREAANHIRAIGEIDLLDWTLLQAEVADNLARGVQDMRPRKNGPCHALLLEFVRDRKRKALAVRRWILADSNTPT